jgi:hypothetical protein
MDEPPRSTHEIHAETRPGPIGLTDHPRRERKILKTHEINAETRPGPIGLTDHPETQRFRYQTHHLSSIKAKAKSQKQNNSQH